MGDPPSIGLAHLRCGDCPIRHRAICSACTPEELVELDQAKFYRSYAEGETIAWAGEPLPVVGSVVRGVATLATTLPDGRRQMIGLLLPSDFLGRPGRRSLAFDVVAATDMTFCLFHRQAFERILNHNRNLERRLLLRTLDELDAAREWMLLLGRKTARERVASLFVIMARRDADLNHRPAGDGQHFPLYLTREAMADYLGLTVETVSRQVTALRRADLIRLEESRIVQVPNLARLAAESGDDGGPDDLLACG